MPRAHTLGLVLREPEQAEDKLKIAEEGSWAEVHTIVSEPVTTIMAATDFAPTGPMLLLPMFSDESLVSLLLWMASQTALTPSSLRLLKDKSRAVSPPLAASPGARAAAPSASR